MIQLTRQPVMVLTGNPVLQSAVASDLMKDTKVPFVFTSDPRDFISALDLTTLILVGDDLAQKAVAITRTSVPGWTARRFRPSFEDVVLLTAYIGDVNLLRPTQHSLRADCIVPVPLRESDLQRLRKRLTDLDPPF